MGTIKPSRFDWTIINTRRDAKRLSPKSSDCVCAKWGEQSRLNGDEKKCVGNDGKIGWFIYAEHIARSKWRVLWKIKWKSSVYINGSSTVMRWFFLCSVLLSVSNTGFRLCPSCLPPHSLYFFTITHFSLSTHSADLIRIRSQVAAQSWQYYYHAQLCSRAQTPRYIHESTSRSIHRFSSVCFFMQYSHRLEHCQFRLRHLAGNWTYYYARPFIHPAGFGRLLQKWWAHEIWLEVRTLSPELLISRHTRRRHCYLWFTVASLPCCCLYILLHLHAFFNTHRVD